MDAAAPRCSDRRLPAQRPLMSSRPSEDALCCRCVTDVGALGVVLGPIDQSRPGVPLIARPGISHATIPESRKTRPITSSTSDTAAK